MRNRTLAAIGVVGALTLGATLPALAQDPDGTTTQQDAAIETRDQRRADHRAEFASRLADELGIEPSRVEEALTTIQEQYREERQAARRAMLEERLSDAVASGQLTREQADAILEAVDQGVFPAGRHGGHRGGPFGHGRFGPPDGNA